MKHQLPAPTPNLDRTIKVLVVIVLGIVALAMLLPVVGPFLLLLLVGAYHVLSGAAGTLSLVLVLVGLLAFVGYQAIPRWPKQPRQPRARSTRSPVWRQNRVANKRQRPDT